MGEESKVKTLLICLVVLETISDKSKYLFLVILPQCVERSIATQLQKIPYHFYFLLLLQTFQRIQRNRQSRIRVKLSRRAGKRSDEILEEDEPNGIHHHAMHLGAHKMEQPQSSSTPGN